MENVRLKDEVRKVIYIERMKVERERERERTVFNIPIVLQYWIV